jgi:hypothetical protein
MLLENINSNMEDMIKMVSTIQSLSSKYALIENQNKSLRSQVRTVRQRNDQLSLSILQDQSKISKLTLDLETAKNDIKGYLEMIEDLRSMKSNLEEKNDEMVQVIEQLKEQVRKKEEEEFNNHVEASGGESFFVSIKKKDQKASPEDYDTNIRESKVIPNGNPMAQTKKFPGVVSSKDTFKKIRSRQASKKARRDKRWRIGEAVVNGEIRELLTDSSKTSKADNKVEDKGKLERISVKNQTQPGTAKEDNVHNNVYNSHRPDTTLNNLHIDNDRIRSRSKPLKQAVSGTDLRNKYQALRSKQKVKLYKRLKNEALSKDIEKRLKMASKSPRRDNNYLGLDHKEISDVKRKGSKKSNTKKEVELLFWIIIKFHLIDSIWKRIAFWKIRLFWVTKKRKNRN